MFSDHDHTTLHKKLFDSKKVQKYCDEENENTVTQYLKFRAFVKQAVKHWINYTRNKKDLSQFLTLQYSTQFEKIRVMVKNYRQRKGKAIKELKSARMIFKCLK